MKVLEHGNTYKQIRCPHCHALLEYSDADIIKKETENELTSAWLFYKYIICLDCNESIILEGPSPW